MISISSHDISHYSAQKDDLSGIKFLAVCLHPPEFSVFILTISLLH